MAIKKYKKFQWNGSYGEDYNALTQIGTKLKERKTRQKQWLQNVGWN